MKLVILFPTAISVSKAYVHPVVLNIASRDEAYSVIYALMQSDQFYVGWHELQFHLLALMEQCLVRIKQCIKACICRVVVTCYGWPRG